MTYKPLDNRALVRPSTGTKIAQKLFNSQHNRPCVGCGDGQIRSGTVVSVGKPRFEDQESLPIQAGDNVIFRGGEDIELEGEPLVLVDGWEILLEESD